jgi:hypothetical protein
MSEYLRLGLKLQHADNSVEAGILRLYQQLSDGTLKIFSTCQQLLADLRYYHRNERGQVVKKQDHLVERAALCHHGEPAQRQGETGCENEHQHGAPVTVVVLGLIS